MLNIEKQHLPADQYFQKEYKKTNIVLHHTVSSTAESPLRWWRIQKERIGTAYVIGKDGRVIEAFPPQAWAHHLGLKTANNTLLNRQSIGIELVNEGPVKLIGGKPRWLCSKEDTDGQELKGQYVTLETPWRGHSHFAAYTDAQYIALKALLLRLSGRFELPLTILRDVNFDMKAPSMYTIYSHSNVRMDKTDISPAFDFAKLGI